MDDIKLNEEQKQALDIMESGETIFITGAGGTGKSFLIKYYFEKYKSEKHICMTSMTGCSAVLLGGITLHSALGIKLGNGSVDDLVKRIRNSRFKVKVIQSLSVLIIDELSMCDPDLFDKLEEVIRIIRHSEMWFGGIQLILSGDFLQLPCVKKDKFCFEAKNWKKVKNIVYLTEIIRQSDAKFQKILNKIRVGNIDDKVKETLNKRVGKKLKNDYGIEPTILYPLNVQVNRLNQERLEKELKEHEERFEYDLTYKIQHPSITKDVVDIMKKNLIIDDKIILTLNCQVMLLQNLDLERELCNGSRGVITGFVDKLPVVRFLNGVELLIKVGSWDIEDGRGKKLVTFHQIPLKLAYAISIHKSQGQTLDYVSVNLDNVFEFAQGYVALARVKNLQGLSIESIDYDKIIAHPKAIEYYKKLNEEAE